MESVLTSVLKLQFEPVAIIWSDEKPDNALQFKKKRWGCVMTLFAQVARGKTAVFDRDTFGCWGGGVGLGFGNQYLNVPGGIEGFYRFLSSGNETWGSQNKLAETICTVINNHFMEQLRHGERYVKSPDLVKDFVARLPIIDVPWDYVIFKPLKEVDAAREKPVVIIFTVTPDQLSALTVLANYARDGIEHVTIPFAAGCQTIGILPYSEAASEYPRAVIGLTDLAARKQVRMLLGKDILTFAVPLKMFYELEAHIKGSFLEMDAWKGLVE